MEVHHRSGARGSMGGYCGIEARGDGRINSDRFNKNGEM